MENNVIFAGNQTDVQNYYSAAKILAHASVAGEGLPTVLLEAMGLGIPVVCTDSKVGPKEILGNNDFGLLTRVQDPEDMADKLYQLFSNDELYHHYQKMGKSRMAAFSKSAIKTQIEDCLLNLV